MLAQVEKLATPSVEWSALWPVLVLLIGAVVLMVLSALVPRRAVRWHAPFAVATAAVSIATAVPLWFRVRDDGPIAVVADAVRIDGIALFLGVVIASGALLASLLAPGYLRRERLQTADPYVLLLLSASGGLIMAAANDLLVLFLGLEILSIAVYVLAGIHVRRARSGEAALKYFVLGAFSSAFFLYGIALTYGATGSTSISAIRGFLGANALTNDLMLLAGMALLLVGLGFKVAAVPFHAWTPDVYEGSPSPIVAYMASAVKAAGFAGLIRVFLFAFAGYRTDWQPMVYVIAVLTLVVGAVLAVSQTNVKRMLAYSSINHAGFILIGLQAATDRGTRAMLFYLATYAFTVAGSFAVVTVVGRAGDNAHQLEDYRGLARRSPLLAFSFLVFLLAQAGVPLTTGFLAKFGVIGAAVDARSFWLALVAMLSSVVSAYVYLRIVLAMYDGDADASGPKLPIPAGARAALVAAVAATVGFGLWPQPVNQAAKTAVETSVVAPAPDAGAADAAAVAGS
ncbi:MAG: NADH-quinone oxidoreductase subunit N [Acidimicrobiales bacterium]|mgnify:CR=1 FL=1|nr:NADH-quinone oxidoreductase subunit N [Acidimicrobiales bacterium]HRW38636.1 NADH-quinone oxidoreductase subunit N [Aquihabitans sp.]